MNIVKPKTTDLNVYQALSYLKCYKDTMNVDDLAMVEEFLLSIRRTYRNKATTGDSPSAMPLLVAQEVAAKQAIIDRLMLEFCPDEMTAPQMAAWAASQRRTSAPVVAQDSPVMTDERIEALFHALDGKALIIGENQMHWNKIVRRAFARAIEAESRAAIGSVAAPAPAQDDGVLQALHYIKQLDCRPKNEGFDHTQCMGISRLLMDQEAATRAATSAVQSAKTIPESATPDVAMEDPVMVPRGLLGACSYVVHKYTPDSPLLQKLRAITFGRDEATLKQSEVPAVAPAEPDIEAAAKAIYETWETIYQKWGVTEYYKPWQKGGESLQQNAARNYARAVLTALKVLP